jgi:hypothetical protein
LSITACGGKPVEEAVWLGDEDCDGELERDADCDADALCEADELGVPDCEPDVLGVPVRLDVCEGVPVWDRDGVAVWLRVRVLLCEALRVKVGVCVDEGVRVRLGVPVALGVRVCVWEGESVRVPLALGDWLWLVVGAHESLIAQRVAARNGRAGSHGPLVSAPSSDPLTMADPGAGHASGTPTSAA